MASAAAQAEPPCPLSVRYDDGGDGELIIWFVGNPEYRHYAALLPKEIAPSSPAKPENLQAGQPLRQDRRHESRLPQKGTLYVVSSRNELPKLSKYAFVPKPGASFPISRQMKGFGGNGGELPAQRLIHICLP